jgi:ATP-dependent Clp protease ATP-binding subunit ClpB
MTTPADRPLDPTLRGTATSKLEKALREGLLAQDHVIDAILPTFQRYFAGLNDPRLTVGNFLFLGPTGVGKTLVSEILAEHFHSDVRGMIRIDCGEFADSHEVAKLLGSPPGYAEPKNSVPRLHQTAVMKHSDAKQRRPSIILFDEIEKAHYSFSNITLGITSNARLTTSDGRETDFSNSIVMFTSNLGAAEMKSMTRNTGFGGDFVMDSSYRQRQGVLKATVAANKYFSQEFMGRIEVQQVFNPLGPKELRLVLSRELCKVGERFLATDKARMVLEYSDAALDWFLANGANTDRGARDLTQCLNRTLVTDIACFAETEQVSSGDVVRVDVVDNQLSYSRV